MNTKIIASAALPDYPRVDMTDESGNYAHGNHSRYATLQHKRMAMISME